ncbi:hypothetical protein BEWA_005040 [Theileria equi strain WA]|uniref:J domain-containing protein n=1 Tax=Theileria equi strain WA TaxID=1537102 RepID=L0B1H0_THEEQ|nr:hypothetical protein BEWA_005040 [Theileria equi strain WA]AFZ81096.1 hypothetical protein BEWA_005040 [Theileria equi strain WA]|eukprot:XP_004830762.1 hypothetical protein BEWA_005040 [Theileria equi strain WA]
MTEADVPKLYAILGVDQTATTRDIVKAYRLAALKSHPDKTSNLDEKARAEAKTHFIQLQHAYDILKDDEKRKNYDLYGWEGEEDVAFAAAYEFYKSPIKEEDIIDFSKTYKGSKAEEEDLLDFYKKNDGSLTNILFSIPLSEADDLDRFVSFYKENIKSKTIESTDKFTKTSQAKTLKNIRNKYKSKCKKDASVEDDGDDFDSLAAQIMANRKKRADTFSSLITNLESKYGNKKKKLSK